MQWIAAINGIISLLKHSKALVDSISAFIAYVKMKDVMEKSNKEIDKDVQDLADAVVKRAKKMQAGEPITKEDNDDVKNKARKFYDNFGRIDIRPK